MKRFVLMAVRTLDSRSTGPGFPSHHCAVVDGRGKPLAHAYLCHQAVQFGSSVRWEVNRHTVRFSRLVSMDPQLLLTSGRRIDDQSCPMTLTALEGLCLQPILSQSTPA